MCMGEVINLGKQRSVEARNQDYQRLFARYAEVHKRWLDFSAYVSDAPDEHKAVLESLRDETNAALHTIYNNLTTHGPELDQGVIMQNTQVMNECLRIFEASLGQKVIEKPSAELLQFARQQTAS